MLPLPIRIAEPACDLFISPDGLIPADFYRGASNRDDGWAATAVATPALASLYGSTIYFQYLFLHMEGNAAALKTSDAVEATFTTQPPGFGVSMVVGADPVGKEGRVFLDHTPVLRLLAR